MTARPRLTPLLRAEIIPASGTSVAQKQYDRGAEKRMPLR